MEKTSKIFFFQAEDGIRDRSPSRGLGDVYKRQIVCASALYGGTYNLFAHTIRKMGVKATFVDPDCTEEELNAAFQENTKAVFGETIANPALTVFDFEKFAKAAHAHHVPLIVDNTFATPINCRPFEWGADIVTHSTTKYMDGHAACVGGAIVDSGNFDWAAYGDKFAGLTTPAVSYTHLRAHETDSYLVCRLLLEKKKLTLSLIHISEPTKQAEISYSVFCL